MIQDQGQQQTGVGVQDLDFTLRRDDLYITGIPLTLIKLKI